MLLSKLPVKVAPEEVFANPAAYGIVLSSSASTIHPIAQAGNRQRESPEGCGSCATFE